MIEKKDENKKIKAKIRLEDDTDEKSENNIEINFEKELESLESHKKRVEVEFFYVFLCSVNKYEYFNPLFNTYVLLYVRKSSFSCKKGLWEVHTLIILPIP
jgi:hypothetical protein